MRQGGFTIIEVMIVIAIIAMLLMFAAPNIGTWIQNTRLRSSAEAVTSCMQTARLEAIKRNTIVSCQLTDPASSAWSVCLYDAVNNICQAGASNILASRTANEDAGITAFGVANTMSSSATALAVGIGMPASSTFDSFGRLASTAPSNVMRVDVRNPSLAFADERRLTVYITLGGQIRMCDPKLVKATNPMGCQ
jgi:type IV fimbrial biogenesis protein FimT